MTMLLTQVILYLMMHMWNWCIIKKRCCTSSQLPLPSAHAHCLDDQLSIDAPQENHSLYLPAIPLQGSGSVLHQQICSIR